MAIFNYLMASILMLQITLASKIKKWLAGGGMGRWTDKVCRVSVSVNISVAGL